MSNGRQLIRKANYFAREHRLLSYWYFLSGFILMTAAFLGTVFIDVIWIKTLSSIVFGLLICRMFVLYHDYRHQAILNDSPVVDLFMTCFGWFALAPHSIWNESHEHHHNYNSKFSLAVLGSFPVMDKKAFLESSSQAKWKYLILRHPLVILFAYWPIFLISFCAYPFFESPKKYWDCGVALILHMVVTVILYTYLGIPGIVFSQTMPFMLFGAIGGYVFYAQHNFPEVVLKTNDKWDYLEAALHSSSFIRMNRVWRWITANIGYHHIHHVNSRIPFYRLPEAMDAIAEFQNPGTTSFALREIWRCLKLKLWDVEQSRMVSLSELKH